MARIEKGCKNDVSKHCGGNDKCKSYEKVYVVNTVEVEGNVNVCNTVDVEGTVNVGNTVTVTANNLDIRNLSGATDSILVAGGTVNVGNTVGIAGNVNVGNTVTVTANNLDIRNLSGATDSISVAGGTVNVGNTVGVAGNVNVDNTVTVTANNLDIRNLSAVSDSITCYNGFTTTNTTATGITSTGTVMNFDTSLYDKVSYYVYNTSSVPIVLKLQVSPTTNSAYYLDDTSGSITIAAGQKTVLSPRLYLQYTRLYYDASASGGSASITVYFNGQL